MLTVELFWDDLSDSGKEKMIETSGCDHNGGNWDVIPLVVIDFDEETVMEEG